MSFIAFIRKILMDPRLEGVDVDSAELVDVHKTILNEKPLMNQVFRHFYNVCLESACANFEMEKDEVEIGAGVSFFKTVHPQLITTDIKDAKGLDKVLDAMNMDLDNDSVSAFYGINCFHHFPDPQQFFDELNRTLVRGGGCVLIEPHHGPFARFMYKRLFTTETFDTTQKEWTSLSGPMLGANQALSYIVFQRDFKKWKEKNPNLELLEVKVLNNYLQYLLSGGLNFRSLVPNFMNPFVRFVEWLLTPLNHVTGLHKVIVIRKKA
ncbi:MAG: methyltransferase domain-containing protein [Bacteroidales bacterium]|nr:methyltransferase domain-containing protein [Bacteroidales bacterium]